MKIFPNFTWKKILKDSIKKNSWLILSFFFFLAITHIPPRFLGNFFHQGFRLLNDKSQNTSNINFFHTNPMNFYLWVFTTNTVILPFFQRWNNQILDYKDNILNIKISLSVPPSYFLHRILPQFPSKISHSLFSLRYASR